MILRSRGCVRAVTFPSPLRLAFPSRAGRAMRRDGVFPPGARRRRDEKRMGRGAGDREPCLGREIKKGAGRCRCPWASAWRDCAIVVLARLPATSRHGGCGSSASARSCDSRRPSGPLPSAGIQFRNSYSSTDRRRIGSRDSSGAMAVAFGRCSWPARLAFAAAATGCFGAVPFVPAFACGVAGWLGFASSASAWLLGSAPQATSTTQAIRLHHKIEALPLRAGIDLTATDLTIANLRTFSSVPSGLRTDWIRLRPTQYASVEATRSAMRLTANPWLAPRSPRAQRVSYAFQAAVTWLLFRHR